MVKLVRAAGSHWEIRSRCSVASTLLKYCVCKSSAVATVHRLQRPLLPLCDFVEDFIGDGGNKFGRNLGAADLKRMGTRRES